MKTIREAVEAEIIAAQEAWGKFSMRNRNRLAKLEAEECVECWYFAWQKFAFGLLALAYCVLFWTAAFAGIWGYLYSPVRAMMNHQ